jgi:hypothetical protein
MHHLTSASSSHRSRHSHSEYTFGRQGKRSHHDCASVPLTPQTASSTGSIQTLQTPPRSHKSKNGMGWLPKFGRHIQDDHLSSPLLSGRSTATGWATPHNQQDGRADLCYSHGMASSYFQVTSGSEPWMEGKRKGVDRSDVDQRVMHRIDCAYPLPCDDQEQRVSLYVSSNHLRSDLQARSGVAPGLSGSISQTRPVRNEHADRYICFP